MRPGHVPESAPAARAHAAGLAVRALTAGYGKTTVLRGVSFDVAPGSVTAVLGANGAGKTTLLRSLAGLIRAADGSIELDGKDLTRLRPHRRLRQGICLIPEGRGVFRSLTVKENLRLHAPTWGDKSRSEEALEIFPALRPRLQQDTGTLSGGEQQMVALARAFVAEPSVVMVDELSMGLAPKVVEDLFGRLRLLAERGVALVVVEQFVHQALALADQVVLMKKGEVAQSGPVAEVDQDALTREYLGTA